MRQVMAGINEEGPQDEMNLRFPGTRHSIQSPAHPTSPPTRLVPQKRGADTQSKTKVTRACDICKAKKSKCSGDKPCITCHRRRLDCTYDSTYSRGRPPSPVHAARHGHAMPETPQRIEMDVESLSQTDSETLHAQYGEIVVEAQSRASPGLEVAGQYSEPTSGLSFLNRAWRRITNTESSQLVGEPQSHVEDDQLLRCAGDKPLPVSGQVRTPSVTRGQELLNSYFTVCIATYRMLHRPTTERWLVIVLENGKAGRPLFTDVGRGRAAVVLSLLAVASFHEEKARGEPRSLETVTNSTNATSDELFMEAADLSATETGFPRLESAQSHLIQVLFLLMSCRFNQAWYTFGHALQIISALGLHRKDNRNTSRRIKHDYIEEQCRKRTFWVAYIIDKYISVIFGRPRHYHDDDIDQDLPDPINDEDMTSEGPSREGADDCHIESLIHHAKLAMIAERISREVYSIKPIPDQERFASSNRLGLQLRKWKADLPPFLGAINPNSLIPSFRRQANALKLSYCHALMLAYRPLLLQSPARQSAEQANLAECIAAAGAVLDSADRVAQEGPLFNAYWWTHYICFCALVVVYVWAIQQSGNDGNLRERLHMLEKAERCLSHLAQATATNSPSRRYSIILQELRAEAKRKTTRPAQDRIQEPEHSPALNPEAARQPEGVDSQMWALFGSPVEDATPGLQNFLENWQTIDWLQLDSSAFGLIPEFDPAFRF